MEVRPGYKQTELYVIPEDWSVESVQRLVEKNIIDKPLDGNHGNIHPKSSDYVDHGIPFVMANNFLNGQVDLLGCKFITKERADKLQKGFSIEGDVLLTHKGTVGNTAIVPNLSTDYIMLTPQVTYYRVRDETQLNKHFLRQFFDSQPFQSLFKSLAGGGTRAYLGIVKQLALPIVKPPINEQRAVAETLSDVDALLDGLERLIAKKRDLKQAAMQQLLTGQTRLPGFGGTWEMTSLKHLVKQEKFAIVDGPFGSQLKVEEYVESGVPVIEMEHLCDDFITERIERSITARKFEDLKRSAVYPGDIIVSKTGSLGKLGLIPEGVKRGLITSRLAKITLDPLRADRFFVFQCLLKLRYEGYWEKVAQGGTMQILGIGMLQNVPIPNIGISEQTAIATVLSEMDAEISALSARRDKTRDLKQAMMQELLTGKTRLVSPEVAHA